MVEMGSAQDRGEYHDETVKLSTRACPASNRVQSMLPLPHPLIVESCERPTGQDSGDWYVHWCLR